YSEISEPNGCGELIRRVWVATDDCGNSVEGVQEISVSDTEMPEITNVPEDITIECGEEIPYEIPEFSDNCSENPEVAYEETIDTKGCAGEYFINRKWTVLDDCGNENVIIQVITVQDTQLPTLQNIPENITSECTEIPEIPTVGDVTATDNCDMDVTVEFVEVSEPVGCGELIRRTWIATDDCGNSTSATQEISLADTKAPDISGIPEDITIECEDTPELIAPEFTDSCTPELDVQFRETVEEGACPNNYFINRMWTVTDDCGNTSVANQKITVIDTKAPQILGVPQDVEVSCGEIPVIPSIADVTASDNCDSDVEVSFLEMFEENDCGETIIRKWTAVDRCGNVSEMIQTIIVGDNDAPVFAEVPENYTIGCDENPLDEAPSLSDNCDLDVEIVISEEILEGECAGNYSLVKTWTATDDCGNSTSVSQTITFEDFTAPEILNVPTDVSVLTIDQVPIAPTLTVTDNCDVNIELTFDESLEEKDCGAIITRIWMATDNCGNATTEIQHILVEGTDIEVSIQPTDKTICIGETVEMTANTEVPQILWTSDGGVFENENSKTTTFSAEVPGVYNISVEAGDGGDCDGFAVTTVTVVGLPEVDISSNGPICEGNALQLIADGYADSYLWRGPNGYVSTSQNPIIEDSKLVNAGEYTVIATIGSCMTTTTIVVEIGEGLPVDISYESQVCEGDTLIINLTGGTQFNWEGPSGFSSNEQNVQILEANMAITSGTYSVTVSDDLGCENMLSADIQVVRIPDLVLSSNSPVCKGSILELYASGGDNYSWTGPNGFISDEANPVISALNSFDPGSYTFTVEVSSGEECNAVESIEIEVLDGMQLIVGEDITVCVGESVNFSVSAQNAIEFLWSGPNDFISTDQNPLMEAVDLNMQGEYIVMATNTDQCRSMDTVLVTVNNPPIVDFAITNVSCDELGAIQLTIANGSTDLTFDWDDLPGTDNPKDRNDLSEGIYNVTVTNAEGCQTSLEPVEVVKDCECEAPVVLDVQENDASCGIANGSVMIDIEGDAGAYSYQWDPDLGEVLGSGNERTNLPSGVYTVIIKVLDVADCETQLTLSIGNLDGPEVTEIITTPATCDFANGSAELSPATYTYLWLHDNQTGNSRNDLTIGTFEVEVIDSNMPDCPNIISIQIGVENPLQVETQLIGQPTCGDANGSAEVIILSGGDGPFNYIWSDESGANQSSRSDLSEGTYTIRVVDEITGCEAITTITLVNSDEGCCENPQVEISESEDANCGETNGSIILEVLGDENNFNYVWQPAVSTSYQAYDLEAGVYSITVLDAENNECFTEISVTINQLDGPSFPVINTVSANCELADGSAELMPADQTYQWPDGEFGSSRTDLAAGLYSVVVSTEGADCDIETSVLIESVNTLAVEADTTNANCQNGGSITLNVEGAHGFVRYDWADLPGDTDPKDRSGLQPGTYSVAISDVAGCVVSLEQILIKDVCDQCIDPVINNIVVQESTCDNPDGSIMIELIGGEEGWNFIWEPEVSSTNQATDLSAGTYQLTIENVSDPACSSNMEIIVKNIDGPEVQILATSPATCQAADGSLELSPLEYTYDWNDSEQGATRNDLLAGTYLITVTDPETACFDVMEIEITEENPLSANANINSLPSCGEANGSVTIEMSGGSGNYTYSWGLEETNSDLSAGNYTLTITDLDTECETSTDFILTDDVSSATVLPQDVILGCQDFSGTVEFVYQMSPDFAEPATIEIQDADGIVYENGQLTEGTYCIVILDANYCLAGEGCFDVIRLEPISVQVSVTDADCDVGGFVELQVSGGNGDHVFYWGDMPEVSDRNNRSDLEIGIYSLTISDSQGCYAELSIEVEDDCTGNLDECDMPVVTQTTVLDAVCGEANGSITIKLTEPPSLYDFVWLPNVSDSEEASGLTAGEYSVTISDPDGGEECYNIVTIVVGNINGPEIESVTTLPANCSANNGSVDLLPESYTYLWSDGEGASRGDLSAGIHQVTMVDETSGCVDIIEIIIGEINTLETSVTIVSLPSCDGSDGTVSLNVTGGSGNYDYEWGADEINNQLSAGNYSVTITDVESGCLDTISFMLTENIPSAEVTVNDVQLDCTGDASGEAAYEISYSEGFLEPAEISIKDGTGNVVENGTLEVGTYCIEVYDVNGCFAGENCFEIFEPQPLQVNVGAMGPDCATDGMIELLVTGGNGNYQYDWADLDESNEPSFRNDLLIGTYEVVITDEKGCTNAVSIVLEDECVACIEPVVQNIQVNDANCGNADGSITISMESLSDDYTYLWSPNVSSTNIATTLSSGTYMLTITTTDPQCATNLSVTVNNANGPEAEVVSVVAATCTNADGRVVLSPDTYSYQWNDNGTGAVRDDLSAGDYSVIVTNNETGCTNTLLVEVLQENPLEASVEIVSPATCGQANGVASILATGNTGTLTYSWGSSETNSELGAGIYTVTVTDAANGCTSEVTFTMTEDVVAGANIQLVFNDDPCQNNPVNVEIDFEVGFLEPASVEIFNVAGESFDTIEELEPGSYCITVKDANDCLAGEHCFELIDQQPIIVEITITPVDCDQPGAIDVNVSGGTGNYIFDWSDLPGSDDLGDRVFMNVGTYSLIVTDSSGCSKLIDDILIENICDPGNECTAEAGSLQELYNDLCLENGSAIITALIQDEAVIPEDYIISYLLTNEPDNQILQVEEAAQFTISSPGDFSIHSLVYHPDSLDLSMIVFSETPLDNIEALLQEGGGSICGALDEEGVIFTAVEDCAECNVEGGVIATSDPSEFCIDDEVPDFINIGTSDILYGEYFFVLSDENGEILSTTEIPFISLEGVPAGTAFIWGLATDSTDVGLQTGASLSDLTGCYDLSNSIELTLMAGVDCGNILITIDTLHLELPVNTADTICVSLEDGVEIDSTTFTLSTGLINGESTYGSWSLDTLGCLVYLSGNISGNMLDTIEVWATNPSGVRDTTYIIVSISEIQLPEPDVIEVTTGAGVPIQVCISMDEIMGGLDSYSICEEPQYGIFEMIDTCLQYTPDPGVVNTTDSVCVVLCDDLGMCDTTLVIIHIGTTCDEFDIFPAGTFHLFTPDCIAGGSYCLDIPYTEILEFEITDNGVVYDGEFSGCRYDTAFNYSYVFLLQVAPLGPYVLNSWTVNGTTFDGVFEDVRALRDSMNFWDPTGHWQLNEEMFVIMGGDPDNTYSDLQITQVMTGAIATLGLDDALVPLGTEMQVDTGYHLIVLKELSSGCTDTLQLDYSCISCDYYSGPLTYQTENCDSLTPLCIDIPFESVASYTIVDNGSLYNNGFEECTDNNFGTQIMVDTGYHELFISDSLNVCTDTVEFTVNCDTTYIDGPQIDTISMVMIVGFTDTICVDTSELSGTVISTVNGCEDEAGLAVDFNVLSGTQCVEATAEVIGTEIACIIICDDTGTCDTTIVEVTVISPITDTVLISIDIGADSVYCIDTTELAGTIVSITDACESQNNGNASVDTIGAGGSCVEINGIAEGEETACMVICDDIGYCDTTILVITVVSGSIQDTLLPVAVNDTTLTHIEIQLDIDVLENDTINGSLADIVITSQPQNGSVVVGSENEMVYTPNEGFCGEEDVFEYSIANSEGYDTAIVIVTVLCEDLVVFNGFSPNGDGVNDAFTILGIEGFPENELLVFNRWGNEVYYQSGYSNANAWDGTWDGKDLPDGTYFYILDDGEGNKYSGYIQIMR
ncbi:MAG: T9SS type B sorting domain-containing protein, partial [Bacteroidetes bacterium]|nr:T9SS type B sorting domain-containing protein [Bacteroidota bacterium]